MNAAHVRYLMACVVGLSLSIATSNARAQKAQAARPQVAQAVRKTKVDVGKDAVERPTENLLAGSLGDTGSGAFANPKVEPGKVTWHADFAAARAASAASGKPVLLFQMMGKLDDQFC